MMMMMMMMMIMMDNAVYVHTNVLGQSTYMVTC